ncbi:MAG: hypothetical protein BGO76_00385 [Caedibacter sp. 38-128]|nr:autotransporter-associated beta strand repeat-containing protein [Holosporales bacterium]OJX06202.1 MAG: hypothetical protein BGO76_00385 [Caedibacter sp. 38-128]
MREILNYKLKSVFKRNLNSVGFLTALKLNTFITKPIIISQKSCLTVLVTLLILARPAFSSIYTGSQVLEANTANAVNGGAKYFYDTSKLNASASNAISGGFQTFNDISKLNASVSNAISGGNQSFNGDSTLNASAANAVSGGTQNFWVNSTLNASAANAINGGTQGFYANSKLNASAANAISGGTQHFWNNSILDASVSNAVSGATINLYQQAKVQVRAQNSLGSNTTINFNANYGGQQILELFGASTSVGKISGGALAVIRNTGNIAAILTVDNSLADGSFSGLIEDYNAPLSLNKRGSNTLTLSGNNTYTGGTTIDSGGIVIGHNNALGTGPVTLADGTRLKWSENAQLNNISFTLNAGNPSQGIILEVDDTKIGKIAHAVTIAGNMLKEGLGRLELLAENFISGSLEAKEGSLSIYSMINNGTVTNRSNSTLNFGSLTNNKNVTNEGIFTSPTLTNKDSFINNGPLNINTVNNSGNFRNSSTSCTVGNFNNGLAPNLQDNVEISNTGYMDITRLENYGTFTNDNVLKFNEFFNRNHFTNNGTLNAGQPIFNQGTFTNTSPQMITSSGSSYFISGGGTFIDQGSNTVSSEHEFPLDIYLSYGTSYLSWASKYY